ncbi:hypothetical protein PRUPE_1G458100 [Prunus persica]|uniref:Uncharacterized protein n=1 Tax=Prunus persica TaxID=3760 RepID=A0A251RDE2_PRUPE|nr:hypothetical protein PRUPE_1G458100 [Prunus persica]
MKKVVAEALRKVALVERDLTATYKASCLNALESWRFDKIYCLPSSPIGCLVAEKGYVKSKIYCDFKHIGNYFSIRW